MSRRLPTAAALALVASLSSGCADSVAPAARVGGETITTDELLDEVAEWAGNDQAERSQQLADTAAPAGYAMAPVAAILQERILLEMLAAEFDDLGLELTEERRQEALSLLGVEPDDVDALFGDFSAEYTSRYIDDYAKGVAVQTELGEEGFLELLREGAKDIEVNRRYGTWDAEELTVVPPEGPRPAPGADAFLGS